MDRRKALQTTPVLLLASSCLLLAHPPVFGDTFEWMDKTGKLNSADSLDKVPPPYRKSVKRIPEKGSQEPLHVAPGPSGGGALPSLPSLEETYAPWRDRARAARMELEALKAQRQKAQAAYEDIVSQLRVRGSRIDPDKEAQAAANIKEIEQRILDKEYEINTTIPDEARQAGVPSSVLSQ